MTKGLFGRLLSAAFVAGAFSVATFAQDTAGTAGQAGQRADADRDRMVTVTGCLRAERDVPGRDESLFQRWGLTQQDYVLTNVQRGQPQAGQPGQAGQTGQYGQTQQPGQTGTQPGQTGTQAGQAGTQAGQDRQVGTAGAMSPAATNMLRLEGKDADQLRQYANQRVEIRGTIEQADRAWFDRTFGEDHGHTAGQPGAQPGTAATQPGTQPGTGVGTTGQQPTGTAGATGDDRLRSIEVESIRPIGSC